MGRVLGAASKVRLGARGRVRWPGDSEGSPEWGRPGASQASQRAEDMKVDGREALLASKQQGGPLAASLSRDTWDPVSCHIPRRPPPGERKWCVQQGCSPLPHVPTGAH